jgi:ureidoacrylate peracid hydrolase
MQESEKLLTSLEELVEPSICAMIVVDMQNDFCHEEGFVIKSKVEAEGQLDMEPFKATIQKQLLLLEAARKSGVRIYHVRSFWDEHYLNPPLRLRKHRIGRTRDPVSEGTWGAEQFLGFEPGPDEALITKHVYSGFMHTGLEKLLREANIKVIIVTGLFTSVCVETTIRDANSLGFYVVEPRDCVADLDQTAHDQSLKTVDTFFGVVTLSDEIISHWDKSANSTAKL